MHPGKQSTQDNKIWIALPVFLALSTSGIFYHEIWLDEAQRFLLARDSTSFNDLIHNTRYEGQPLLWSILLFGLTRITDNVFYMQLLSVLINCITAVVILRSDLRPWEKILILFSYYIFYEYNIISRNYCLSVLFLFLLIAQYKKNSSSLLTMALLIFLLANTHLFALLLSIAFVIAYSIYHKTELKEKGKIIPAILVIAAGWIISAVCIIPPHNYGFTFAEYDSSGYVSAERIIKTLSVSMKGTFYIPDYQAQGHHIEDSLYYETLDLQTWVLILLFSIAFVIPLLIIRKNRFARTLFCLFIVLYLPVYYFLPLVYGIRYFGFFYLAFIACYRIANRDVGNFSAKAAFLLFALQAVNGIYFYLFDLMYPFSESKQISETITNKHMQNSQVFIIDRALRPQISAYTGDTYLAAENGAQLSYCIWKDNQFDPLFREKLRDGLQENDSSLIICTGNSCDIADTAHMVKIASFQNAMLQGENGDIYLYRK